MVEFDILAKQEGQCGITVWKEHQGPGADSGKKCGWGRSWEPGYDVGLLSQKEEFRFYSLFDVLVF